MCVCVKESNARMLQSLSLLALELLRLSWQHNIANRCNYKVRAMPKSVPVSAHEGGYIGEFVNARHVPLWLTTMLTIADTTCARAPAALLDNTQ